MIQAQRQQRKSALPHHLPPRMLAREAAAEHVGVSPITFDKGIEAIIHPKPAHVFGRAMWDVRELDVACDALDSVAWSAP